MASENDNERMYFPDGSCMSREMFKYQMFVDNLNPVLGLMEGAARLPSVEDLQGIIKRLAQIEGLVWAELERRHKSEAEQTKP